MARPVELVVVSDVHLGTAASRAAELNAYLKSVEPERLVLCGDIVDLWQMRSGAWSEAQTKVVRRILKLATRGVPVHYITGNHDGALRRCSPFLLGQVELCDQLELDLAGRRTWFVHGDVADLAVGTPRWLSWLGGMSYDGLEFVGGMVNRCRDLIGAQPMSLNEMIKRRLPAARNHVARFEAAMARLAARAGADAVVCGHIHVPAMRTFAIDGRMVDYLNSGDWVDSLSALEYDRGCWRLVRWEGLLAEGQVQAPKTALDETAPIGAPVAA